jgi:hypothetical protein
MAAFLAQSPGAGIDQIMTKSSEIPLGFYACGRFSNTRVTRAHLTLRTGIPDPLKRRSNTRVTSGPPLKGPKIPNEGPAQPALRRLGVRQRGGSMGSA